MSLEIFVKENRPVLDSYLVKFLKDKEQHAAIDFYTRPKNKQSSSKLYKETPHLQLGEVYKEAVIKLGNFATKGKLLRGLLIMLAYKMYGGKDLKTVLPVAAAQELIHSALLIHDDIIDNDELRRGDKTVFAQYMDEATEKHVADEKQYGVAMGICVGDIAFFLAFELLTDTGIDKALRRDVIHRFSQELARVGGAQMLDVYFGQSSVEPSQEEILSMYRYKTARYTFSLPLALGALLAGASTTEVEKLEKFGETVGIIFQVKDDGLGIFGNEETTGKPVGSDIRENKKTLFRTLLYERMSKEEKAELDTYFGNASFKDKDIENVIALFEKYHIPSLVEAEVNNMLMQSYELIDDLSLHSEGKAVLKQLVAYNTKREK